MKIFLDMPKVSECKVSECLYNREHACHARAITIGDTEHACCDTFMSYSNHTHENVTAGVGACKVADCKFNTDFECEAKEIKVDHCEDHADCVTYAKRM